jgi:hypothetical protein
MFSGHRPAARRRRDGRTKRIAVPFAIPMALGLTLGIMLAVSGGNNTHINQSRLGATASPTVSASRSAVVPVRPGQPVRNGRTHHRPTSSPAG